ncbi:hypothetical protein [Paenibacillus germinis]|nr:hypothetical protein [Paenibacillus germinis]
MVNHVQVSVEISAKPPVSYTPVVVAVGVGVKVYGFVLLKAGHLYVN